jgi:hypothetical protein
MLQRILTPPTVNLNSTSEHLSHTRTDFRNSRYGTPNTLRCLEARASHTIYGYMPC